MLKRCAVFLLVAALINVKVVVFCWDNGGYSDEPSNPACGTHDWIAHHALDWLPSKEKAFILNNLNNYLYGTELPDNGEASDGIGDKTKHHVYFFADGSLQENDSAARAQEEYNEAVSLFRAGDLAGAAKRLGAMTHYISDLASFGHVMGSRTVWGEATNHGYYEDHVNSRTNSYDDEFNIFLSYDGVLNSTSAYNASLTLAYDTTFDAGGVFTCVWMEEHCDFANSAFVQRCGQSLNLAVNLVADVLHTFYVEMVPEFPTSVIVVLFMVVAAVAVFMRRKRNLNNRLGAA